MVELGQGAPGEESVALCEVLEVYLQCTLLEGSWCTEWGSVQGSSWTDSKSPQCQGSLLILKQLIFHLRDREFF